MHYKMPPVTRSAASATPAAAALTASKSAAISMAMEEKRAAAAFKRAEATRLFKELQQKPDVTADELKTVMASKPRSLWDYENWKHVMHAWIERAHWEPFMWYLETMEHEYGWKKLTFMTDVLDTMCELQPTKLVTTTTAMFTGMRAAIMENKYTWWVTHMKNVIDNDAYLLLLVRNNWPVPLNIIRDVKHDRLPELITETVKYLYRTYKEIELFHHADFKYIALRNNERALVLALIANRPASAPFVATPENALGIRKFIAVCLQGDNADMLDALLSKFSMKLAANKTWLNKLFDMVINPTPGYAHARPAELATTYAVIECIIRRYKINVNHIYLNLDDLVKKQKDYYAEQFAKDPLLNPYTWMSNKLSVMALAVLYKNKRAILFLQSLGGTLKRCAFSMVDLTTDPNILKLFLNDTSATKIQQSYKRYMYAPDHPSQSSRQARWNTRLAETEISAKN